MRGLGVLQLVPFPRVLPKITASAGIVGTALAVATIAAAQTGIRAYFPERPTGYVTDVAGALTAADVEALTARIEALRSSTGAEIAVVTLPTIGDYAAVDVAVAIGRAWGVGARAEIGDPRRNTGLVILLVPKRPDDPNSGQLFIATGQGLEGIVTDAAAGRVRDRMRPFLARGDYSQGLRVGVEALSELIRAELTGSAAGPTEVVRRSRNRGSMVAGVLFLLVVLFVLLFIGMIAGAAAPGGRRRRRRRRPPLWWLGGGGFGGFGGGGGGFGGGGFGGGFGGFGGGGGFSGGGAGGRF